ncbi:hypothetical protein SISNIDRAFT_420781, partial [Sistotremastrum niveocremeum HHB9708]
RPSEYLRRRCPICFGADDYSHLSEQDLPWWIVATDACFTHCSLGNFPDPPLTHADPVTLATEDLRKAEAHVNEKRPPPQKPRAKDPDHSDEDEADEDVIPGTNLPRSIAHDCRKTFKAADENRIKGVASSNGDTGIMSLVCRHDRVLFLASMNTPGERQFYPIALLMKFFEHIPPKAKVGVLYNVGCTLHSSIGKWDFIPEIAERIIWAISIFHAYGHHWACQLIYNPRKRDKFGLSNGEQCERIWSLLQRLISHGQLSGPYHRLYTINNQVMHIEDTSLPGLGEWIRRAYKTAYRKKKVAEKKLQSLPYTRQDIEAAWQEQVAAQTKPLPRQHKTAGRKHTLEALAIHGEILTYKEQVRVLKAIKKPTEKQKTKLAEAISGLAASKVRLTKHLKAIGLPANARLHTLETKYERYVTLRANAIQHLRRIYERVVRRHFEWERTHTGTRNSANARRLTDNVVAAITRTDGSLDKTVTKFNKLAKEVNALISKKSVPPKASRMKLIPTKKTYEIDIDNHIWQDLAIDPTTDEAAPRWLTNKSLRSAIINHLQSQRCDEELARVAHEANALQSWFTREWDLLIAALRRNSGQLTGLRFACN